MRARTICHSWKLKKMDASNCGFSERVSAVLATFGSRDGKTFLDSWMSEKPCAQTKFVMMEPAILHSLSTFFQNLLQLEDALEIYVL